MPLNIEPIDRNQRTAFQEREALREKVNEIIETVAPMEITWDPAPTAGHGAGYQVTSEGIKTAIDAETVTRTDADAVLGTRIDNETAARTSADTTLETRIAQEESTRQTADTNIRSQIANEQTARTNADTALGTRIDGKQDLLVSGTNIKTVGGNSLLGAGDIPISGGVQWDTVPTAGHGTGYAVTSEGVKTAVDGEAAARSSADTALGTRIDGKQDTLVSGTNIRTVNGFSLVQAGNIRVFVPVYSDGIGSAVMRDIMQNAPVQLITNESSTNRIYLSGYVHSASGTYIAVYGTGFVVENGSVSNIRYAQVTLDSTTVTVQDLNGTSRTVSNINNYDIKIAYFRKPYEGAEE